MGSDPEAPRVGQTLSVENQYIRRLCQPSDGRNGRRPFAEAEQPRNVRVGQRHGGGGLGQGFEPG